jgi:hypothetical protein
MSESFNSGSQCSQQKNDFSILLDGSNDQFSFSNSIKKKIYQFWSIILF